VSAESDKNLLHEFGFYYVDTLIVPFCNRARLRRHVDSRAQISEVFDRQTALELAYNGFVHGRFFRDKNIPQKCAKERYRTWLRHMIQQGDVLGLFWEDTQVGFIAYKDSELCLHAIDKRWHGQGIAKYFWSLACQYLFDAGHQEIVSSISAANLSVLSLYASLGFRFRDATDIYHRFNSSVGTARHDKHIAT
jgi:RimJ/RimL family protein N-acetyltransferase